MKSIYKWAILGTGNIANKFATALQSTTRGSLWAVGSRNIQRAVNFATKYGAKRPYDDYQKVIDDPEVDVIYIATPHHLHAQLSIAALNAGKAVLCEKPMAMNATQAKAVIEASHKNKTFFMEGLWTLFLPHFLEAERLINQGAIGQPVSIRANFGFQHDYNAKHRLFDPQLGGGSLLDIGIYPLFLAQYFFGKPQRIEAHARLSELNIDLSMQAILYYQNHKMALINSSIESLQPIEAEIFGTIGGIRINRPWFRHTTLDFWDNDRKQTTLKPQCQGNGYNYQAEAVMYMLDKGETQHPKVSHQFSLQLSETMDEIIEKCNIIYPKAL